MAGEVGATKAHVAFEQNLAEVERVNEAWAIATEEELLLEEKVAKKESMFMAAKDVLNVQNRAVPMRSKIQKKAKAKAVQKSVLVRKERQDLAEDFLAKDFRERMFQYQLNSNTLVNLAGMLEETIHAGMDEADIVNLIRENCPDTNDPAQINQIFTFLIELVGKWSENAKTSDSKAHFSNLSEKLVLTQEYFHSNFQDQIESGEQLLGVAKVMVEAAGGKVSLADTLERGREMVINDESLLSKFHYYESNNYNITDIKNDIHMVFTYVSDELKINEIETPKLGALLRETRKSQAILQIFRHSNRAINLATNEFDRQELQKPDNLTVKGFGLVFMKIVQERYSPEHILQHVSSLCSESGNPIQNLKIKIIITNLIRDMINEVSPQYVFNDTTHKQTIYDNILTLSENLEDQLFELEEAGKLANS